MPAPSGPTATESSALGRRAPELAGDLARQLGELVHSEIELAKAELAQKGRRAGIGAGAFGQRSWPPRPCWAPSSGS